MKNNYIPIDEEIFERAIDDKQISSDWYDADINARENMPKMKYFTTYRK